MVGSAETTSPGACAAAPETRADAARAGDAAVVAARSDAITNRTMDMLTRTRRVMCRPLRGGIGWGRRRREPIVTRR
ncbi:hypothetical protein GCM10010149_23240 [Nonomuraea roseoviolacea subsp. roseoviolacea]